MRSYRLFALMFTAFFPMLSYAQSGVSGANVTMWLIIAAVIFLVVGAVLVFSGSLFNLGASAIGLNPDDDSTVESQGIQKDVTRLKKGFDLKLDGNPSTAIEDKGVLTYAVQPKDFLGMSPIPKVLPEVGASVKAGEVLFFDKKKPEVKYVSPVSGEVIEINRAEKRSIASIVILADKEQQSVKHADLPSLNGSRQDVVDFMLASGAWPLMRQRPFNIVPDINAHPKSIFVTTFSTAPQAPDYNTIVAGKGAEFQKGLDVLNSLTSGKVHLGLNGNGKVASEFEGAQGVQKNYFSGLHPAGNVGVHIHHTDPVDISQVVWTVGVQEVIALGHLFLTGELDGTRIISLSGDEFANPRLIRTYQGARIEDLIKDELVDSSKKVRLISGDVLSGKQKEANQFVNFYDYQLTTIEEGDYYEMFGWLLPIAPRPSTSGTFPNFAYGKDFKFKPDTNAHGEKRAFVLTGQYEAVLPMDIYVQHLMKSIIVNDLEKMEGLGIYELVEEDIALAEFTCVSKQPLQQILRNGLETLREQV